MNSQTFRSLYCLFAALVFFTPPVQAQVEFLNQNWSDNERQEFYTTSQGSRMMPYRWFLALEVSDSHDSFYKTRLPELG